MTGNRLQRPQPPSRPQRSQSTDAVPSVPKPYELISFPSQAPELQHPIGHDKFRSDRFQGSISLSLKVQTVVHVSTGIVALGEDVGQRTP